MTKKVTTCEICGEEHKLQAFHWHLKKHGITKKEYIEQYGEIKTTEEPERAVETVTNDVDAIGINLESVDKISDESGERDEKTGSIIKKVETKAIELVKENNNREINENNLEEKNMKEKPIKEMDDIRKRLDESMKEKPNMERIENDLVMLKQGLLLTALYVNEYGSLREMREVIAIARDENGDYTTMVLDNDGILVPPASIENYYAIIKGEGKVLQKNIKLLMGKPIRVQPGPGKPTPARVSTKKGLFGRRSKKQRQPEGISDEDADAFYKEVTELSNE